MSNRAVTLLLLFAVVLLASGPAAGAADAKVDYQRDIKPILSASCYSCHGPEKQKGRLRLDARATALDGGTAGKVIIPGKGEQSPLVRRLRGLDGEDRMPLKAEPLPDEQIKLIVRWIDQGAVWPDGADGEVKVAKHWSLVKPERPNEPKVKDGAWCRNPIDRFVLARLEREGIKPSAEASEETLLRRVSLDLIGLPPTPEEIDTFLADTSPDAYEKQVDRLLASPRYGEKWARRWLDGARYADSNGYSLDKPRSIWKYRDWVIDAINKDMRFDQFSIEQLAGDMLPDATVEQKIATGFHRNTQINEEGGIDPEQFRIEGVMDRVATTGTVFLGLTIACAQCHNHKFDPISQRDYYRMFALFNNADEPMLKLDGDKVSTMVMAERKTPRQSHVFTKGDFTRLAEPVTPGTPTVLHPLSTANPNRLDFACWLFDAENPLTARVTVNRFWLHYFGRGLVDTDNDFGTQGTPPTHPELLDFLATEFVRQGWSMKAMHRLIVTSATYRQSSNLRPELAAADPYNRLVARQSRVRLDAELVRDVALTASSLMADKLGGPSVYPPQPEGVTSLGQAKQPWRTSTGPDRYRRGMYTFQYRMTPHPLNSSFDAPDGTSACTRRLKSNTPLQSLQLLNDEAFVEFAQALAHRMLKEAPASDDERVAYGFRLCTGRKPSVDEKALLLRVLDRQMKGFARTPDDATALAKAKIPTDRISEERDTVHVAAWTIVARVMLNLDETITRE